MAGAQRGAAAYLVHDLRVSVDTRDADEGLSVLAVATMAACAVLGPAKRVPATAADSLTPHSNGGAGSSPLKHVSSSSSSASTLSPHHRHHHHQRRLLLDDDDDDA